MTIKRTREPIGTSPSDDYDRLLIEATAIAYRIAEQLAHGGFPEDVNWGNVGDMAETVKALRHISDRMFAEGEYAPEKR